MTTIPNDPVMLLSFVNTQLRDNYSSLEEFIFAYQCDREELEAKLKSIDYEYNKELNKFVKDNYPSLKGAADCRYFGALCNIVLQIPKNEFVSERKQLWFEIKEYRKIVIKDSKVRKKTKYAAILSYLGYDLMLFVYQRTQIRGRYLK